MKYCLKCGSELSDYATTCGVCNTAVPQEQPSVSSSDYLPTDNFDHNVPTPKKKKTLLFALIGGSIGIIALVLILCLTLCSSTVEFGISSNDAHDAMLSNDYIYFGSDVDTFDSAYKVLVLSYYGETGDLGVCTIDLAFNIAKKNALYGCTIDTRASKDTILDFCRDQLDVSCQKHRYYDSYNDCYEDIYLGENSNFIIIIEYYDSDRDSDLTHYSISLYDKSNIPPKELDYLNGRIDSIK